MGKKLLMLLGAFLVIYLLNFSIPRLMPGDPFDYTSGAAGDDVDAAYSEEQKELLRAYYGLDKPFFPQLRDTIVDNLHGDFGQSIHYKRPVADILLERLPWSLWIMGSTLALSLLLGVALALLCVRRPWADRALYPALSALAEVPPFLTGVLLLFLVAARAAWIPLSGAYTPFAQYDGLWQRLGDILVHSLMPVCALTLVTVPKLFFTARASFFTILGRPYLTNARAKGLTAGRIRTAYILRNAATPIVARFFLSVGGAVGGTILVENVFAYPGLGTVLREAVQYRDYPMLQGVFLLSAVLVLLSLAAADVSPPLTERRRGMRRKWLVPHAPAGAAGPLLPVGGHRIPPPGPAPVGGLPGGPLRRPLARHRQPGGGHLRPDLRRLLPQPGHRPGRRRFHLRGGGRPGDTGGLCGGLGGRSDLLSDPGASGHPPAPGHDRHRGLSGAEHLEPGLDHCRLLLGPGGPADAGQDHLHPAAGLRADGPALRRRNLVPHPHPHRP